MEAKVQRIQTATLQEQVYGELRDALLEGRFVPGESLKIRVLAEDFGTSEMPVREALQRLVAERALVQPPNRSVSVPTMTRSTFEELMIIRKSVEGLAARLAADKMTAAEVDKVVAMNEAYVAAIERRDSPHILSCNHHFHAAVYEGAKAPILMEIINSLWLRFGPFLAHAFKAVDDPFAMFERASQFHAAAVNALRGGDGEAARAAVEEDLTRFAEWYCDAHDFEA
jgi:DNA-binding GntR family transcriptional regulator